MKDCRRSLQYAIKQHMKHKLNRLKKKIIPIFSTVTGNSKPLHSGMNPENFHVDLSSVMAKKTIQNILNCWERNKK